jgi:hypothetical protein
MKDPAVLIYLDKWISSTNGMKGSFRGWYMDLMMYQYDKGFIPNDEDAIFGICRVRPSEYDDFKQMLEQVLKQKFELIDNKWINNVMSDVLQKRNEFKEKREKSGNIGVVVKLAKSIEWCTVSMIDKLKTKLFSLEIEEINQYKHKHLLEHLLKLYIDVDVDKDIIDKINNFEILTLANDTGLEFISRTAKIEIKHIPLALSEFVLMAKAKEKEYKNIQEFKNHFINWINKRKEIAKKTENKDRL